MNRCKQACIYREQGYNCAQAVIAAFADLTGLTEEQSMAVSGGFGGGVGGCREEVCGAISGGVMALGLLYPHLDGGNQNSKQKLYELTQEFRSRFYETFGQTRCAALMQSSSTANEKTPVAAALGITEGCDVFVVTAVELVEQMLAELAEE